MESSSRHFVGDGVYQLGHLGFGSVTWPDGPDSACGPDVWPQPETAIQKTTGASSSEQAQTDSLKRSNVAYLIFENHPDGRICGRNPTSTEDLWLPNDPDASSCRRLFTNERRNCSAGDGMAAVGGHVRCRCAVDYICISSVHRRGREALCVLSKAAWRRGRRLAAHPPLITLMGGIMRKTPVSAARRRLKFGWISERKQTELIHHPVCLDLSGVCLPFGWREINRLVLTSGNILPTGCVSAAFCYQTGFSYKSNRCNREMDWFRPITVQLFTSTVVNTVSGLLETRTGRIQ